MLYTREGKEFTGTVNHDGKHPTHTVVVGCHRCHVVNGERVWLMGMENGRPYSRTGFNCWTCGNTGVRKYVEERLYTAEQLEKVNAAAEKRAAKRAEEDRIAREQAEIARAAAEAAYRATNADFLAKLATLTTGNGSDFWDRLAADLLATFRIPSERQVALVEGEVAKRAKNASSAFIGVVGDKVTLTITVERVLNFGDRYYPMYISLCRDQAGNVIVYKGTSNAIPGEGETATVIATVAEHTTYNGIAQTRIMRPKAA